MWFARTVRDRKSAMAPSSSSQKVELNRHRVRLPTLVGWREIDRILSLGFGGSMVAKLPNSKLFL